MIRIAKILDPKCGVPMELQEDVNVVRACATKSYILFASLFSVLTLVVMMIIIFTSKSNRDNYEKDIVKWKKENPTGIIPSKPNIILLICITLAVIVLLWALLPLSRYVTVNSWKSKEYKQKLAKNAGLSDSQFYMQQEANIRNRKSNENVLKAANLTASAQLNAGYSIADAIRNK